MRGKIVIVLAVCCAFVVSVCPAAPIIPDAPAASRNGAEPERRLPRPMPRDKQRTRESRETQDQWTIPRKDLPDKTKLASFESGIVGRSVNYLIYLPPGYERIDNEKIRSPVLYMLPNYSGDAREVGAMIGKLDEAIPDRTIPPMIVVAVQGIYGSMYTDTRDRGRLIESVIVRELVP